MKARGIVNCCVMLLWFVATHHCAFEQLFSSHGNRPFAQTATTPSDSSSQSDCPSHSSGDPSSHSEGKSCGNILQPSSSNQLNDASKLALVPIVNSLVAVLSNSLGYSDPLLSSTAISFEAANSAALSQRAHSLSIAPNAPPVTLA